jgi:hypothetical protein
MYTHVHTLFQFSKLIKVIISLSQTDMYFTCCPVQRGVKSTLFVYLLPVIIKKSKEHDMQERICFKVIRNKEF